jgi:hypothetical protein
MDLQALLKLAVGNNALQSELTRYDLAKLMTVKISNMPRHFSK